MSKSYPLGHVSKHGFFECRFYSEVSFRFTAHHLYLHCRTSSTITRPRQSCRFFFRSAFNIITRRRSCQTIANETLLIGQQARYQQTKASNLQLHLKVIRGKILNALAWILAGSQVRIHPHLANHVKRRRCNCPVCRNHTVQSQLSTKHTRGAAELGPIDLECLGCLSSTILSLGDDLHMYGNAG
ncbi:hypothetical protein BJ508DRAFT_123680 [Ascobolus immersus RN42]|uniref:Uncharacterized protein n=1 Tax=Ascobolus immersus RN42 TaxID=1160509 RepID=A0A3N4I9P0_ASCIM|nr:hypothetical protein BJ508DRAFT_123680 [Ascobolus immersus RN42]